MSDQRWRGATVLVAIIALSGCSDDGGVRVQSVPTPTASQATPSTVPSDFPEQVQILAQYRAFFAALAPASRATPANRLKLLQKVATEPVLTRTVGGMAASSAAGEVLYGQDIIRPELTKVDGTTAMLRDCQDSSGAGRMKASTGKKVTVGRKNDLALVTMKRGADGVWRVSTVAYQPAGSCSAGA